MTTTTERSGHTPLAVQNGFLGLRDGLIKEMSWMDVSGWVSDGGAEIGTNGSSSSK